MEPKNNNRHYTVHELLPSDTPSAEEAPAYSIKDDYHPPSDHPPSHTRGVQIYEMETLPDRIFIRKHLDDERSKRNKSFVTIIVLSLALGLCLVGFAVFFILYGMHISAPWN